MLKRIVAVLMSLVLLSSSALTCIAVTLSDVSAWGCDFGEGMVYGGLAVDVDGGTVLSENGGIYFRSSNGGSRLVIQMDAKYLNYFSQKLWFVSGGEIFSCSLSGDGLKTEKTFNGEAVSCLYVVEGGMFYLKDETVCSYNGIRETELFSRSGIKGFVPNSDGSFLWMTENPEYVYVPADAEEIYDTSADEFIRYMAVPQGDGYIDISVDGSVGTDSEVATVSASEYLGPYVTVGDVTLPLQEHMPGTFFSKNGEACVCHHTSSNYCIQSVGNCNCMRYYPTGYKETCEVDLLGAQCFAFARLVFYKCFGFIDYSSNSSLYYSAGSLARGSVTENSIKALMMKAATGAHVRLSKGHSVSILTMDEESITVYHGNAGGDGVLAQPCIVSTKRFTWAAFAEYAAAGVQYVNMPYNYPDSSTTVFAQPGYYKLTSDVNLRAETSTQSEALTVIPESTVLCIDEVDGYWGKTEYEGQTGWVYLLYSVLYSRKTLTPSGNKFVSDGEAYLFSVAWQTDIDGLSEYFPKQSLSVTNYLGESKGSDEYVVTGDIISIVVEDSVLDTAQVCLAGDVNCNGRLDVGDYLALKRYMFGTYILDELQLRAADVNGDGAVNSSDYTIIRRFFFEQSNELFSGFMTVETSEETPE